MGSSPGFLRLSGSLSARRRRRLSLLLPAERPRTSFIFSSSEGRCRVLEAEERNLRVASKGTGGDLKTSSPGACPWACSGLLQERVPGPLMCLWFTHLFCFIKRQHRGTGRPQCVVPVRLFLLILMFLVGHSRHPPPSAIQGH